jgi:phage terminase large subunit-like protein
VDLAWVGRLPREQQEALLALTEIQLSRNRLAGYRAYAKQAEFHRAGGDPKVRERLLMAGNQLGKTHSAGFETAMHLTGRYPKWWNGAVFDSPVAAWAAGVTGEVTRDSVQRTLCGRINALGTGAIPSEAIKDKAMKRGVADAIDTLVVAWGGGGDLQAKESLLGFKSYDQGREKFQSETLDFVWLDEEPDDLAIYTECLTRTNATDGIVYMTFTPLKGMTEVVRRFLIEKMPGTHVTNMTIEDAEHYTPEQRSAIIASYPAHEREARTKGIPSLGSGRIFPVPEDNLREQPVGIPPHWPRICGLDLGWDHPTAAVWLAWDRDTDTVHVYDAYRVKEATPVIHAAAIKARGAWIPVAWPHDGLQHDKGSGEALKEQYRKQGVNMLTDRATHAPQPGEKEGSGGNGVEAGLMDMLDRMQTGRFRVAAHLHDWWEEFRLYHREDGKVVKEGDDLMSATRYAVMMLRHAKVNQGAAQIHRTRSDVGTVPGMGPLG